MHLQFQREVARDCHELTVMVLIHKIDLEFGIVTEVDLDFTIGGTVIVGVIGDHRNRFSIRANTAQRIDILGGIFGDHLCLHIIKIAYQHMG